MENLRMDNTFQFLLNDNTQLNLNKIKTEDFHRLFINGSPRCHTGPIKWSGKALSVSDNDWQTIFKSLKTICKEHKLKEFHFRFIHRIVVAKKELHRFGITDNDECLYCGDPDSIDHSFFSIATSQRCL